MKIIVMKEEVHIHRSLKTRVPTYHTGPHGEGPELLGRQRGQKKAWAKSLLWFS